MPLETGSFINDLTPTNPPNSDAAGQGDDHLRLIKATVQGTFPNMGAIFGQVRSQDTALSISSIWNTNHFICSASATATVVLTLPPAASITTGFYVDITTVGAGTVSLLPSGAASINGGVSLSIPRLNSCRAYFVTGTGWLADTVPHAQGGTSVISNLAVDGTLSVSGATTLNAVTISGAATLKSTLSVSAAVTLGSTLSVSGATTLASTLSVSGATVLAGLTVAGTTTLSGTVVLSNGQLQFPASQNASANANTLDDYEEGTWTPTATFQTPGNLSVVYSTRTGSYTKVGRLVTVEMIIVTSTFTFTTSSGVFQITGLPFTVTGAAASLNCGITNGMAAAGFSYVAATPPSGGTLSQFTVTVVSTGANGNPNTASFSSGTNIAFSFCGTYQAA